MPAPVQGSPPAPLGSADARPLATSELPLELRPAAEADLERMARLHAASFPEAGWSLEQRVVRLRESPRATLADRIVAVSDGTIVATCALLPLSVTLGGRDVRAGGIAGVAVAPEARCRGVAGAMVAWSACRIRDSLGPLALLYPFRESFYAELGWGRVAERERIEVAPQALPLYGERTLVRSAELEDRRALLELHAQHCARTPPSVRRDERQMAEHLSQPGTLAVHVPGEGYLLYRHSIEARGTVLVVAEMTSLSERAERALIGFLAAQRDQVAAVRLDVPRGHPLSHALTSRGRTGDDLFEPYATVCRGMMARVLDVRAALQARGGYGDGTLVVRVEDTLLTDNRRPVVLAARAGLASVEEPDGRAAASLPSLWASPPAFAKIYAGALRPSDAARLGLARLAGPSADLVADTLFPLAPPFPFDVF